MYLCTESMRSDFGKHWHLTEAEGQQCTLYMRAETAVRRGTRSLPLLAPVDGPRTPAPVAPVTPPRGIVAPARPGFRPSTDAQRDYVRALGGDVVRAQEMSVAECSDYIDELKRRPTIPGTSPIAEPVEREVATTIVPEVIKMVKDGRYACRVTDESKFMFFKVSRPESGTYRGCVKIMTQHSEEWKLAIVLWPSGKLSVYRHGLEEFILTIIANRRKAGDLYAQELGDCQICGKKLTDERSRYYGIGPDCETRHAAVVSQVDEEYGPWVMGKLRSEMA